MFVPQWYFFTKKNCAFFLISQTFQWNLIKFWLQDPCHDPPCCRRLNLHPVAVIWKYVSNLTYFQAVFTLKTNKKKCIHNWLCSFRPELGLAFHFNSLINFIRNPKSFDAESAGVKQGGARRFGPVASSALHFLPFFRSFRPPFL